MEHTPEPWHVYAEGTGGAISIGSQDNRAFAFMSMVRIGAPWRKLQRANARRIAAAVNACKGIPTEALSDGVVRDLVTALQTLLQLRNTIEVLGEWEATDTNQRLRDIERPKVDAAVDAARAAIAKATQ